jgi:hypothetical protein
MTCPVFFVDPADTTMRPLGVDGNALVASDWPGQYDYLAVTSYSGNNPLVVVYKQGGAAGTIVGTLTMTYDGSGNVLTATRS